MCQPNIEGVQGCSPGGSELLRAAERLPPSRASTAPRPSSAVAALKAAGIPVYVVGLPGTSAPAYASLLDELAVAGGTAQPTSPKYYRVDRRQRQTLLTALKKIAAKIVATCEFKLTESPPRPTR